MNPLQVAKPRVRLFHTLFAALSAGLATYILFYAEIHWWAVPVISNQTYFSWDVLRVKMFTLDPINCALVWTFFFGILHLVGTYLFVFLPIKLSAMHDFTANLHLNQRNAGASLHPIQEEVIRQARFGFFGQRLRRLEEFYIREKSLTGARAERDDILAIDEEQLALCFTPVSWSEVALPLLGFLGTVVGMSGALPAISNAVDVYLQTQDAQKTAPLLTDGFKKLAFAFDTTFTGLAGVIIIGLFHLALKSFLATRMALVRKELTDQMSNWKPVSELKDQTLEILAHQSRVIAEAMHERAKAIDERSEKALTILEHVIVHAQGEGFDAIRNTLFAVVVPPSENDQANEALKQSVFDWDSHWQIVTCGFPSLAVSTGIVVVRRKDTDYCIRFQWTGDFHFAKPQPIQGLVAECIAGADGEDYAVKLSDGSVSTKRGGLSLNLANDEHLLPLSLGQKEIFVVIKREPNSRTSVSWCPIETSAAASAGAYRLGFLPDEYEWSVASSSPRHQTIAIIGARNSSMHLLVRRLITSDGKLDEAKSLKWAEGDLRVRLRMSSSSGHKPTQVIQISAKEFLALDEKGNIEYWHADSDRSCPTRLSADPEAMVPWAGAVGARILTNGRGLIAIIAKQQISFWRVLRGGNLHQLSEPTTFVGPQTGQVKVTADGRYLVGFHQKDLFVWNFPVCAIDSF